MDRVRALSPSRTELVPWTDKKGRFHRFRALVFALLLLPALWLLVRGLDGGLGPEPITEAIHSTGYWTIWLLVASLSITPLKALSARPNVVVVRRMIGNAALLYGLLHLGLYATDQNWKLVTVVSEIVKRFYLTIGFVALLGLVGLGLTSTDGWIRTLGKRWKRLHRLVYALVALGLFHYVLQSKLDVSQAMLASGLFAWLMLWRLLPLGADRGLWPLLGISLGAALATLGVEYAWYRLGTHIDPMKIVRGEFDIEFGLRPAGQVLLLGMAASVIAEGRRLAQTPVGRSPFFTMGVYALGAFVDNLVAMFMGWSSDDVPIDEDSPVRMDVVWLLLFATLGMARWKLRGTRLAWAVDAVWLASIAYQVVIVGTDSRRVGAVCAALIMGLAIPLAAWISRASRGAALTLLPLCLLLAYEVFVLF